MEEVFMNFGDMLANNIWLTLIMALIAGIISSFSPCVLSSIPLIIGFVGGYAGDDKKRAFSYSSFFCIGLSITFTALGILSALLGSLITGTNKLWYIVLSGIMLIVGLQMLGVINVLPQNFNIKSNKKGLLGALLLGIVGGIISSPCSTPVLIAILAYVAGKGSIVLGAILLILYSIGHCTLVLVAGTSVGFIQKFASSPNTNRWGNWLKKVFGILIVFLAFYLFYIGI